MALRVLIVPDKFKGTLTAHAAAEAIAQGWRQVRANDQIEVLPMSDGGDGFGEVLAGVMTVEARRTRALDAAHRPVEATWWFGPREQRAIIESARVVGLALLPTGKYHPFDLDTYGLGAVLEAAASSGASQCLIGIGGSATNDGGFGLARALGWRFLTKDHQEIRTWTRLTDLVRIEAPRLGLCLPDIVVGVDVQNPLLGPSGATRVYGPQKGLREEEFPLTEACLEKLQQVVQEDLGLDAAGEPGTGAAGGLGYGLRCFCNGRLESGFALFARAARLEERIRSVDLVITGEGAIDRSTLMGKGVGEIAALCACHGIPCLGLAAMVSVDAEACGDVNFTRLHGIVPKLASVERAKAEAADCLQRLASEAARVWQEEA